MVMRLVNICSQISQGSYFKGMQKLVQFGIFQYLRFGSKTYYKLVKTS